MRARWAFMLPLMATAASAGAATLSFTGSYSHQNPPAALGGRCAPAARTVGFGPQIAPAAGTSNLGSFAPSGSHCINPPLPTSYGNGLFAFDFGAGDVLSGTYDGRLDSTGSPQVFANIQDYVVTGGTGRFLGASGAFQGTGTVAFAPGSLPTSFQTLSGTILVAGVPEPATWGMMIVGFGAVGASLRAGRRAARLRAFPS